MQSSLLLASPNRVIPKVAHVKQGLSAHQGTKKPLPISPAAYETDFSHTILPQPYHQKLPPRCPPHTTSSKSPTGRRDHKTPRLTLKKDILALHIPLHLPQVVSQKTRASQSEIRHYRPGSPGIYIPDPNGRMQHLITCTVHSS